MFYPVFYAHPQAAEALARALTTVGPSAAADAAQSTPANRALFGITRIHPHDVQLSLSHAARVTGALDTANGSTSSSSSSSSGSGGAGGSLQEPYSTAAFVRSASAGFAPIDFTRVVMRLTRAGLLFMQRNDRESLALSPHLDHDPTFGESLDEYHKLRAAKQAFTRNALLSALLPFGKYSPFHRFMCSYLNASGLTPALQAYRAWYALEPLAEHAGDVANINFKHLLRFVPRPERQVMLLTAFQTRPLVVPLQPYNALDDMLFSFYPSDYRGVHFAFTPARPVSLSTALQDLGYHISHIFSAARGRAVAAARSGTFIDVFIEFFEKFCVHWLSRCAPMHAALAGFNAGLRIAWEHQRRAVALAAASPESLSGAGGAPPGYLRTASGELFDPLLIQTLCHRLCTAAARLALRNFDPIKALVATGRNRGGGGATAAKQADAEENADESDDDDGKRPTLVVKNETGLAITNAVIVLKNPSLGDFYYNGSASSAETAAEYDRLKAALARALADPDGCLAWLLMFQRLNDCCHAFAQVVESCSNRERGQSSVATGALARTASAAAAASSAASINARGAAAVDPAVAAAASAKAAAARHAQAASSASAAAAGTGPRSVPVTHMYSLCLSLCTIAVEWIADAYNPTAIAAAAEFDTTGVRSPLALPPKPAATAHATTQDLASVALAQGLARAGRWTHLGDLGQAWPAASSLIYDPAVKEDAELWWLIKALVTVYYTAASAHGIPVAGAGASPIKLKGQPVQSFSGVIPPPGHVLRVVASLCLLFYVPLPLELDQWWRATPTIDTTYPAPGSTAAAAAAAVAANEKPVPVSDVDAHLEKKTAETELVTVLLSLLQTGLRPSAVLAQILALPPRRGGVMTAPPSYEALSSAASAGAEQIAADHEAMTVVERVLQHVVVLTEREQVWLAQMIFAAPPKDRSRGLPLQAILDIVSKPSRYVLAWPDGKDKALSAKIAVPELQVMTVSNSAADSASSSAAPASGAAGANAVVVRNALYAGLADINAQRLEKVALLMSTMLQTGQFNMLRTLVRVCFPSDPIAHFVAFLAAFRRRQFAKPPLSASLSAHSNFASPSAAAPWIKYAQVRLHEQVLATLTPRERAALDLDDDPAALALAQLAHISSATVDDETNGGADAPAEYCFALFAAELHRQDCARQEYNAGKARAAHAAAGAAAAAAAAAGDAAAAAAAVASHGLYAVGGGIEPVAVPATSAVVRLGDRKVWLGQAAWSRAVCKHLWERFLALQSFLTDYDRRYLESLFLSYSWTEGLEPLSRLPGGLVTLPAGVVAANAPAAATKTEVSVAHDGSFVIRQTRRNNNPGGKKGKNGGNKDESKDGDSDDADDQDNDDEDGADKNDGNDKAKSKSKKDSSDASGDATGKNDDDVIVVDGAAPAPSNAAARAAGAVLSSTDALAEVTYTALLQELDAVAAIEDIGGVSAPDRAALIDTALHQLDATAAPLALRAAFYYQTAAVLLRRTVLPPVDAAVTSLSAPGSVPPRIEAVRAATGPRGAALKQLPGAGYPQSLYSTRDEKLHATALMGAADMLSESAVAALRLGASGRLLASSLLADADADADGNGYGGYNNNSAVRSSVPLSRGRLAATRAAAASQARSAQQQQHDHQSAVSSGVVVPPAVAAHMDRDRAESALQVIRALVLAAASWRALLDADAVEKARALAREAPIAANAAPVATARFAGSPLPAVGLTPVERARLSLAARRCGARAMWLMTVYDLHSVKLGPKRLLAALSSEGWYTTRASAAAGAVHALSRAAGEPVRAHIETELGHEEHGVAIVSRALLEEQYDRATSAARAKVRANADVVTDLINAARKTHVAAITDAAQAEFDAAHPTLPAQIAAARAKKPVTAAAAALAALPKFDKDAAVSRALASYTARTPAMMTADSLATLPVALVGCEAFPLLEPGARVPWADEDGAARRRALRDAAAKRRVIARQQREAQRQMRRAARIARRSHHTNALHDDDDDDDEDDDERGADRDGNGSEDDEAAAADAADAAANAEAETAQELDAGSAAMNRLVDDSFYNDTPDVNAALVLSLVHALVQRCRFRSALDLLSEVAARPESDRVRQLVLGHPPLEALFHLLRLFVWLADPNLDAVDAAAGRRVAGAEAVATRWLPAPALPAAVLRAARRSLSSASASASVASGGLEGEAAGVTRAEAVAAAGTALDQDMVKVLYHLHEGWRAQLRAAHASASAAASASASSSASSASAGSKNAGGKTATEGAMAADGSGNGGDCDGADGSGSAGGKGKDDGGANGDGNGANGGDGAGNDGDKDGSGNGSGDKNNSGDNGAGSSADAGAKAGSASASAGGAGASASGAAGSASVTASLNPAAAAADAALLRGLDLALSSAWLRLQQVGLLQSSLGGLEAAGAPLPGRGAVDPEDDSDADEAASLAADNVAAVLARSQERLAGRPRLVDLPSLVSTLYGLGVKARLFLLDHLAKAINRFVAPHLTLASAVFSVPQRSFAGAASAAMATAGAPVLSVPSLAHNTASAVAWALPQVLTYLHTARRVAMTEEAVLLDAKVRHHFIRRRTPAPGGGIPISRTSHMAAVLGLLAHRTRPIALSSWLPATLPLVVHTADVFELSPLTVVAAPPAALFAELIARAHTHRLVPNTAAAAAGATAGTAASAQQQQGPAVSTSIRGVSVWSVLRNFFSLGQAQIHVRAHYHAQRYRAHTTTAVSDDLLATTQSRAVPASVTVNLPSHAHVDLVRLISAF